MNKKTAFSLALLAFLNLAGPAAASGSAFDQIKSSKAINLGYRENSAPFSSVGPDKQPQGYSIDLCKVVAADLAQQLGVDKLDVRWVPVTAQSRFELLKSGKIDIECGNTTQTLTRRADFDFSVMTFADGASLLFRKGAIPAGSDHLTGQRIAVVTGTTTEKALEALGASARLGATLVKVADHDAALKALADGKASAYSADRTVLLTGALASGNAGNYELSPVQITYEPYGLMMRPDQQLRLAVDRSLSRLYRTGAIMPIFQRWFASLGTPGEGLKAMFLLNTMPE
jgi:ABC-type amino acid transport substrate-binding protein